MKILLADDHDLVRDALYRLLKQDDPSLDIAMARDLKEVISACRSGGQFDVILLDFRMPGMRGLNGVQKAIEAAQNTSIILMSGNASRHDVLSALEMGVKGFVPKTMSGKALLNALLLVAAGETYLPANLMMKPTDDLETGMGPALTEREKQVLVELRQGNSNKEIGRNLNIAETTVKLHVRALSEKLSARNRTDIVMRAIDLGLV